MAFDVTIELLTKKDKAQCLRVDPTGRKSISLAKDIRKRLKGLEKGSPVDIKTQKEIMSIVQPRFRESMFSGADDLEIIKFPS